jgi:hypothetical protein
MKKRKEMKMTAEEDEDENYKENNTAQSSAETSEVCSSGPLEHVAMFVDALMASALYKNQNSVTMLCGYFHTEVGEIFAF